MHQQPTLIYEVGGGPTLVTSILLTINGKKAKIKHPMTIIGNAIYSPISNASDRFSVLELEEEPGMTPPSVAAFISSSVASHDFIFSSRLSVEVVEVDDESS